MNRKIYYISPSDLTSDILNNFIYPNLEQTHYWSDCWEPDFYVDLARCGFISICFPEEEHYLLVPEIQESYAVLDWENLHVSRKVKPFLDQNYLNNSGITLGLGTGPEEVLEGIQAHHGEKSWLSPPYVKILKELSQLTYPDFEILSWELRVSGKLAAGELGYRIGAIYTSLTGFFHRNNPLWNNFGKLQMVLLAEKLKTQGYSFWNLGHPYMKYKLDLGARILPRQEFLGRWLNETKKGVSHE